METAFAQQESPLRVCEHPPHGTLVVGRLRLLTLPLTENPHASLATQPSRRTRPGRGAHQSPEYPRAFDPGLAAAAVSPWTWRRNPSLI
eukprot:316383-Prorocentrum_minimum.AAC.3